MKDLYVLILSNLIAYPTVDDLNKNAEWFKRKQGINIKYEVRPTVFTSLKHKDFGVAINKGDFAGTTKTAWGLDGIKERIRQQGIVPYSQYHAIVFLYELDKNWDFSKTPIGAWTYPNDLNGSVFIEVPSSLYWEKTDDLFRVLNHELMHAEHRICWWRGQPTFDSMDQYDKELDIEAKDGNRARNLKALEPYIDLITIAPRGKLMLWLLAAYEQLLKLLRTTDPMKNIKAWADAIQEYEGFKKPGTPGYPAGSRSFRNNNPGNLRYTHYTSSLGADGFDDKNFCIFEDYQEGYDALCEFLHDAASNELIPYRAKAKDLGLPTAGHLSLINFFEVYAPSSDNNEPNAYALFVASKIGVQPTAQIKDML